MVLYSYLFKNFPQFVVIHTVNGFSTLNKEDIFLEISSFFYDPIDVDNLISGSFGFSNSSLNIWTFLSHVLLKPCLETFEHYFAGSPGKKSAHSVGDLGSVLRLGRSSGEGKGYPLQYSGLENFMDYTVHGVAKSQT